MSQRPKVLYQLQCLLIIWPEETVNKGILVLAVDAGQVSTGRLAERPGVVEEDCYNTDVTSYLHVTISSNS